jgi:hypothetical protein
MSYKICITGDSWGCGEWTFTKEHGYTVTHFGLEHFFRYPIYGSNVASYQVVNVSQPGSDNLSSVTRLIPQLEIQDFDFIFWFASEPLRQIERSGLDGNVLDSFNRIGVDYQAISHISYDNILDWNRRFMIESLHKANGLGKKIYCIGSTTKLDESLFNQFPNLVCYVPSLAEFLYNDFKHPKIWQSRWLDYIEDKLTVETLDKFVEDKKVQDSLHDKKYADLFFPDGQHPNRFGFKLLYDKIVKELF